MSHRVYIWLTFLILSELQFTPTQFKTKLFPQANTNPPAKLPRDVNEYDSLLDLLGKYTIRDHFISTRVSVKYL